MKYEDYYLVKKMDDGDWIATVGTGGVRLAALASSPVRALILLVSKREVLEDKEGGEK